MSLTAARHCEAQTPTRSLRHKESHGRGKWSQVGSLIGVETCAARFVELCLRPSADPSFSPWGTPNFGEGLQRLGSPLIARAASGESPDGPTIHPRPTRTRASSLSSESRGDFPEDALALPPQEISSRNREKLGFRHGRRALLRGEVCAALPKLRLPKGNLGRIEPPSPSCPFPNPPSSTIRWGDVL